MYPYRGGGVVVVGGAGCVGGVFWPTVSKILAVGLLRRALSSWKVLLIAKKAIPESLTFWCDCCGVSGDGVGVEKTCWKMQISAASKKFCGRRQTLSQALNAFGADDKLLPVDASGSRLKELT